MRVVAADVRKIMEAFAMVMDVNSVMKPLATNVVDDVVDRRKRGCLGLFTNVYECDKCYGAMIREGGPGHSEANRAGPGIRLDW